MRHAIAIAPLGPLADPDAIVRLAVAAEAAGWDGVSTWDSLGTSIGTESADPFVALAAVAAATTRLRIMTTVVALPRRRPQLVAQAAGTLDRLSHGRLIIGVGAGGDPGDFEPFGESFDRERRMAMLDEGLVLLDRLLRGETVDHAGAHYPTSGATVGPRPAQEPRPPIWVDGSKPGALRRAACWDGWITVGVSEDGTSMVLEPGRLAELVGRLGVERAALGRAGAPFDVAVFGLSEPDEGGLVAGFAAAGATWWLESLSPLRGSIDELLVRIAAGPARPALAGVTG